MSEQSVRKKIAAIDEKRERVRVLRSMSDWPMFSPSKVTADRRRGIFRWFGIYGDVVSDVELTRAERSELREWMTARAERLNAEADELSAALGEDS